jgi:hypothetical protein
MEPLLIAIFLIGAGGLWLGAAGRRAAERPAPRSASSPTGKAEGSRAPAPAAEPVAAVVAAPAPAPRAAPAPPPVARAPEPSPEERRKHPRIRSDQTFTITPFAGRAMMAQCCDLSAGGIRFGIVGGNLRAGDLVRVTFNIGSETVAAIGSVLRVRELDPITAEVSLEFVRLDPWAAQLIEQALADGV